MTFVGDLGLGATIGALRRQLIAHRWIQMALQHCCDGGALARAFDYGLSTVDRGLWTGSVVWLANLAAVVFDTTRPQNLFAGQSFW